MISVVIPTIWKSPVFKDLLLGLCKHALIEEIIIISNDKPTFKIEDEKIKIIQQEQNIGVNPAWNLGVSLSKNEYILILNDDLLFDLDFIDNAFSIKDDYSIVSINYDQEQDHIVEPTRRPYGFGCAFLISKSDYVSIPEDLKIFFGDDWLFDNCLFANKKIALLPSIKTNGILSSSSKDFLSGIYIELSKYSKHLDTLYNHEYRFSIVVPYHHSVVSFSEMNNLLGSLKNQTFTDFEIIVIHDGPNPDREKIDKKDIKYLESNIRVNDWGHTPRDFGISISRGQYIIHLNCDNLLYENALEKLNDLIERDIEFINNYGGHHFDSKDILIFPIILHGQTTDGFHLFRDKSSDKKLILTGYPPQPNFIDCMQLVMKRSRWNFYGGWYDKSFASDGAMYSRFVRENLGALYESEILGEHR